MCSVSRQSARLTFCRIIVRHVIVSVRSSLLCTRGRLHLVHMVSRLHQPTKFSVLVMVGKANMGVNRVFHGHHPFCSFPRTKKGGMVLRRGTPPFPMNVSPTRPSSSTIMRPSFTTMLFRPFLIRCFFPSNTLGRFVRMHRVLVRTIIFHRPIQFHPGTIRVVVRNASVSILRVFEKGHPIRVVTSHRREPTFCFPTHYFRGVRFLSIHVFWGRCATVRGERPFGAELSRFSCGCFAHQLVGRLDPYPYTTEHFVSSAFSHPTLSWR